MKKILSFLSAPYLMGTLFIILAASMGIATFVENDFGTNAAKALYYNTWWFEGIFVLLAINMFLNFTKPYLWKKGKLAILLFHLSFFIIVIGAALTRYIGYEGMMHIREGEATNQFLSLKTYIAGSIQSENDTIKFAEDVLLSEKSKDYFSKKFSLKGHSVELKSVDYIANTNWIAEEGEGGKPLIRIVVSSGSGRQNVDLFLGEKIIVGNYSIGFGVADSCDFLISQGDEELLFTSKHDVYITDMGTQEKSLVDLTKPTSFYSRVLYGTEGFFMVQTNYIESAILKPVPATNEEQGSGMESIILKVKVDDLQKQVVLQGRPDMLGEASEIAVGNVNIRLSYGAKLLKTPFSIHLNDFQLERYPGSESPSSFASEVTLIDSRSNVKKDFRIFMNNILNYDGYRFYQSSYDMDEKGTVLSVNNDFWGTLITYIGYFLLALSMIMSLGASKSRFRYLTNLVSDLNKKKKLLLLAGLLIAVASAQAQDIDAYINVSKEQAKEFGELWVQDNAGRTKPMNSLNGEILRKLVKHNSFKGYSEDRIVLSVLSNSEAWKHVPLITVKKGPVRDIVGNSTKKASFSDFFGASGNYKLHELVEKAYRTKPAYRSKLQNDIIKIDEQVNVFYLLHSGQLLKIFPIPADDQLPWLLPGTSNINLQEGDSLFVRNVFSLYLQALKKGNAEEAKTYVDAIRRYQNKFAAEILPSEKAKQLEIFYNGSNIFLFIAPILFVLGFIFLIIQFVFLFIPKKSPIKLNIVGNIFFILMFLVYTGGMALRWYVSGHAPWSDGYESMLLIGWALLLAGLIFSKKSAIVLSIAAIESGIVLLVAHLSWMNPEITNLVPVLKSYWLTIHVAVIVSSYGFLGLGALAGFFNLILIGLKKKTEEEKLDTTIIELSSIIEMGLTIGLYMMTVGAFLGGVWANESWGRYWGWDPKETWSMVTILIYAFILHMRFIPGLKSVVVFNVVAVIGFFSVIMTYFGVNYYLAGMHSYAKGDPVPVPDFVYYTVLTVLVVSVYAVINAMKVKKFHE